jgi:hypothetical protein
MIPAALGVLALIFAIMINCTGSSEDFGMIRSYVVMFLLCQAHSLIEPACPPVGQLARKLYIVGPGGV